VKSPSEVGCSVVATACLPGALAARLDSKSSELPAGSPCGGSAPRRPAGPARYAIRSQNLHGMAALSPKNPAPRARASIDRATVADRPGRPAGESWRGLLNPSGRPPPELPDLPTEGHGLPERPATGHQDSPPLRRLRATSPKEAPGRHSISKLSTRPPGRSNRVRLPFRPARRRGHTSSPASGWAGRNRHTKPTEKGGSAND
jgi:hypothetical protein